MIRRIVPFAAIAIVASLLIVVPALGSSHEDAVRLHLGSDSRSFSYDGVVQTITVARNGCQINSPEPLIDLSSTNGGTSQPGLNSLGIGVKSSGSNSNGTPCGQTDSTEILSLARTGSKLAGRSFNMVRLDVEMTGNAVVKVNFFAGSSTTPSATSTLQTGTSITADQSDDPLYDTSAPYEVTTANYTSATNGEADTDLTDACAAPNSSGPNNAGNDNCLWTIDPGVVFDRLSITTTIGTVSLEGSGDFGNDTDHDSLFFLANATPTADGDSYSTDEDTPLTVAAPGVLGNDGDADGDGITAALGTDVSNGTLILNADGSFSYTPNANYFGSDSFTYTATDGTASSTAATVNITVNPVNDPPQAAGDATVGEDSTTDITVATDVDDDVIYSACTSTTVPPATVTDNEDGTVSYTPPANFDGTDTLECIVNDGEATVSIDVTVAVTGVNDGPVANDDEGYVDAGASVIIDVLANDTDVDDLDLTITGVTQGASGSVSTDGATVTYASAASFTGSDTFTYTVSDGDATDTGTVTVYELFECGETLTVEEGDTSAEYKRLGEEPDCVDGKPYFVDIITTTPAELPTIVFQPRPQDGAAVEDCSVTPSLCLDEFAATISFGPRDEANAPDTGELQYDPVNREPLDYNTSTTFRTMEWCEIVDFDPYTEADDYSSSQILPSGESWCIASVSTSSSSTTETLTEWILYGIGDPAKRI